MRSRQAKLYLNEVEQAIQYEISRFPFADGQRKQSLRKAYRDLEAIFRDSVRGLEELNELQPFSLKLASSKIDSIEQSIRSACRHYEFQLGVDLKSNLENLCDSLSRITKTAQDTHEVATQIEEISIGFERIKRSLSAVHKM